MAIELSYLLITPYTIAKSRTGGIMARLLSRTDLELVAAQIITPDQELTDKYAQETRKTVGQRDQKAAKMFQDYIKDNFAPHPDGRRERVMMLLFRGEDACRKLFETAGSLVRASGEEDVTGTTIRDTYADLVLRRDGAVKYFEPAVLTPPTQQLALAKLKLFADFIAKQPNIVKKVVRKDKNAERTLVIIKPDNWRHPSTKPGNVIDVLSRTGLRIVGCKIHQMSIASALEFYGPVQDVLREKLAPNIGNRAKDILERELGIALHKGVEKELARAVGVDYADDQFYQIVEFMSGLRPDKNEIKDEKAPGTVKCMILIYEGHDAISKIRSVLGPTDPTKAPAGTVRRDFGHNVMVNTAHASDSPESVKRESKIVKIEKNNMCTLIRDFLKEKGFENE